MPLSDLQFSEDESPTAVIEASKSKRSWCRRGLKQFGGIFTQSRPPKFLREGDSIVPVVLRGAPGFPKPLTGQALGYSTQRRDWEDGVLTGGRWEVVDYCSLEVLESSWVKLSLSGYHLYPMHTGNCRKN